MPRQLDILALEPFFGGVRRAMLETIVRYSRHRWTVLKLPPRRIERRLTTAANWFAEQLSRHWVGRLDLLFTSEAMNLPGLLTLFPQLAAYPSVVYFHDNQLPGLSAGPAAGDNPIDLVNLNTARSATEVWFNSAYHQRMFLMRAKELVDRHPALAARNPVPAVAAKAKLFAPPVDLSLLHEVQSSVDRVERLPQTLFVETRDADVKLLNGAIAKLREQNVPVNLVTVGPVNSLDPTVARTTVSEHDEVGQLRGMLSAGVIVSVKPTATSDYLVVRGMAAGCRPVLPDAGIYPEMLPTVLHPGSLYAVKPVALAGRIIEATDGHAPAWDLATARAALKPFDAIGQCRLIDERIEQLVAANPVRWM
jgi:hypothetical protein